jgi:hypothetical protein
MSKNHISKNSDHIAPITFDIRNLKEGTESLCGTPFSLIALEPGEVRDGDDGD